MGITKFQNKNAIAKSRKFEQALKSQIIYFIK